MASLVYADVLFHGTCQVFLTSTKDIFYDTDPSYITQTFILDLWPAAKSSPRHQRRQNQRNSRLMEKEKASDKVDHQQVGLATRIISTDV